MIDVLRYIEKMKEMYEGEGPRITAQEPRIGFKDGLSVKEKNLIKKAFPDIKFNFDDYTYGIP